MCIFIDSYSLKRKLIKNICMYDYFFNSSERCSNMILQKKNSSSLKLGNHAF